VIRVLLVDDHAMVRAGLEQLLAAEGDIEVVASVADGATAVEHVRRSRPDVVLMDLSMPGLDGIRATAAIRAVHPQAKVVVLTSFGDRERVLAAVDAGATGYLLKEADPDELVRGIRAAARGESPVSPRAGQALFAARAGQVDAVDQLTPRERQVLLLVADGLVNKQIARRLGISEKTVKAHLTRVFAAIGVSDRTQAALWAERHGLLRGERTT
jgi:DNA-binding NarL/FixJ family response regulator